MNQQLIFQPVLVMMLLTFVVWVYMYARRLPFIVHHRLTPDQLQPQEFARLSPPAVSNPSDNLKNLFELPTLFYAVSICLVVTGRVDGLAMTLAWVFVAFRILHSAVHCTVNIIVLRFWLYVVSCVALWLIVIRAAIALLR